MIMVYSREPSSDVGKPDHISMENNDSMFQPNVNVATKFDNKCGLQPTASQQSNRSWMDNNFECLFHRNLF